MSLISAIKDAIFTETPSDVTVNERSFVSVLLGSNDKFLLGKNDFKVHSYRGKSLVLTRHLGHFFVTYVVLGIIWLIYQTYSVIHWLATGRWRGAKSSSGINFVIGSTVLITTIIVLIYIIAFLIKDVVLSPNNARINNKGVITVDQPCLETHSFFLLNSATYWTSTDIQVSEGDEVYITASGSMYSDVFDMHEAAIKNRHLKYARSILGSYRPVKEDTIGTQYCLYGRYKQDRYQLFKLNRYQLFKLKKGLKEYPRFGSLLYQIASPNNGYISYNNKENEEAIQQITLNKNNNEFVFPAAKSGVLYLTFNDILLDNATLTKIFKDANNGNLAAMDLREELKRVKVHKENDIVDEKIWFQDNLGEVLINVRIEKSIRRSDLPWYKKPVVFLYRHLNHFATRGLVKSDAWVAVLIIIVFFTTDVLLSRRYKKRIKNE